MAVGAGMLDSITKKGSDSGGAAVDVNALSVRGTGIIGKVRAATINLGESLIYIYTACGNKQSAEKLQASIDALKAKKDDSDQLKKSVGDVNNAASEINQIDLQSKMDAAKARSNLGKSILKLGAATIIDLSAANDSKQLVTDSQSALKAVQANPMKYGASAVSNIKGVLDTSSFVANNIPTQVKSIQGVTVKLVDYAKINKISTPSKQEIEAASNGMVRE